MPTFDSIRQQAPWMQDWSDEEVMVKLAELTGKPLSAVASDFGVTTGKERSVGGAGITSGWEGLKGLVYSGGAAVTDVLGAKGAKDWLERQAFAKEVQSELAGRPELERIEEQTLGSALPYAGYQIAKQIPNLAGSITAGLLVPEVAVPAILSRGAAMLPRALGGGGLDVAGGYAAKRAALETGQAFGKQVVGGLAFNEAQSVGSLYQAAREGGDENAGAKALLGSPLHALSETLPEAMLFGRVKGGSGFTGNILTRMGKSAGVQGISGATSEGLQNEMEMALNPTLTEDQKFSNRLNSIAAGGLVEGILGGLGGMSKGGRLPNRGSLVPGANASDQTDTTQTSDDRATNTAIDSSSTAPSVLQAANIDEAKLATFVAPTGQAQADQQLAEAKVQADEQAQQQAQMQVQMQQQQRTAALQSFGVISTPEQTKSGMFLGQAVYGADRLNAIADALNNILPQLPESKVLVARALMDANANTGGKRIGFKFDGSNIQKSVQKGFEALDKLEQKLQIDQADSLEEVADILNNLSQTAGRNELEFINAVYESITGQHTIGYEQSQGATNGKLQVQQQGNAGVRTIPEQGGASQAAGEELGLLRPELLQPVQSGGQPVGSPTVQVDAGREDGVRAGTSNGTATSVSGNVSAPSPQVIGVHRGQQTGTQGTVATAPQASGSTAEAGQVRTAEEVGGENAVGTAESFLNELVDTVVQRAGKMKAADVQKYRDFIAMYMQSDPNTIDYSEAAHYFGITPAQAKRWARDARNFSVKWAKPISEVLPGLMEKYNLDKEQLLAVIGQAETQTKTMIEEVGGAVSAVDERDLSMIGEGAEETGADIKTKGRKSESIQERFNTAETLAARYTKLADKYDTLQDEGKTAEAEAVQAEMDAVTQKLAELETKRVAKKAAEKGEKNAVQEPSAEEVPVRKRAGGGEGVRKENTGKRKAAKEVIKAEAKPEEKWNAIAEQYGLPKFADLPAAAQADVVTAKGELTLAKANEIFEANKKQFEKGQASKTTHSIVDADQTYLEDVASRFPAVQNVVDTFNSMGIGNSLTAAQIWATTTDNTFLSDGVYEVLPEGWQGVMFHEDNINPDIDPDAELNVAHELGHAIDMAGHGGIYSNQIEMMVSAKDGKIRPMGVVMQEMYDLYQNNGGWKQYLEYPFDHTAYPKLANNAERIRTELFAQLFSAYTNPTLREAMRLTAPVTYKYMTEVFKNVESTKSFYGKTKAAATDRRQAYANRNAQGGAQARQTGGDGGGNEVGQSYDKISSKTKQWVGQSKGFIDNLPTWARGPVRTVHNVLFGGKETALGLMITEDIAELAKKFMRSVTKYVEVQHLRNSLIATKERRLTSIKTLFEELDTNTRRTVNDLIASMTVNGKWAFDPQLEGVKKELVDPTLQARFNSLPTNAQKVIKEVFAVGRESLQEKKDTIRKIIDDEFNERMTAAETDVEKADVLRRKKAMEKQFAGILTINPNTPYSPLKRFGTFVVVAKSPAYAEAEAANDTKTMRTLESDESHYIVEFAETAGEAEQLYDELNALGKYHVAAPFKKSTARDSLYRGTDLYKGFAKLKRVLAAEKGVEASLKTKDAELLGRLETMVNDLYLLSLADSSARKSEMQRKKISGFNRDMMRAFFTQGMADAHYIANLKTADQTMDTMVQMQKEAGENRAQAYPYLNEIMAREAQSLEVREPSLGDAMNRMAGDWFLTFSPSFYFQQMTQTYVLSLPWLAGKYNYFKSERALRQAYKQILPLVKGTGLKEHMDFSKAPEDVREMLKDLVGRGRIDIGVEAELGGFRSEASNPLSEAYGNAANRLRGAINRIEALNRSVAAIAAYRLEMQKSGDKVKATEAADKVVHVTHGSYDGFNTPRLFNKNAVTRSLTQFRRFQIIQLSMLARMVHNAFSGASKTERAMGRKQLAFLLGHTFALGGIKGMPIYVPAALAYSMLTAAFGDEDDPEDFEAWLRSKGGVLLARGIPANMGIDLSGKLGMGNVLSVLPYTDVDLSSKQGYANLLLGASGPFLGGLVPKMIDGVNLVAGGDYYRGLEQMLPNGLNNGIKMLRFNTEGITMRNGDVVLPPEEIGFVDTVFQGLGLPTTTVTERQYTQGQVIKFDQFYSDRAKEVKNDYTRAYKSNDSAAMSEARDAWNNLQESRVKYGYNRKPLSDLIKAPREQAKRERSVIGGVETTKSNKGFVRNITEE